jgi:leucine dehydrogenase
VGDLYNAQADLFALCAIGRVINVHTIPRLKVLVVAGSSNDQLARARNRSELEKHKILYVADYAINTGASSTLSTRTG